MMVLNSKNKSIAEYFSSDPKIEYPTEYYYIGTYIEPTTLPADSFILSSDNIKSYINKEKIAFVDEAKLIASKYDYPIFGLTNNGNLYLSRNREGIMKSGVTTKSESILGDKNKIELYVTAGLIPSTLSTSSSPSPSSPSSPSSSPPR
jgi:hypothetical protein